MPARKKQNIGASFDLQLIVNCLAPRDFTTVSTNSDLKI
jgi:hypothetical protein